MEQNEMEIIKSLDYSFGSLIYKFTMYISGKELTGMSFSEFISTEEWRLLAEGIKNISERISIIKSVNKIYDSKEELEDLILDLQCRLQELQKL